MKKTLLIVCLSFTTAISALAQTIIDPDVNRADDMNVRISKIETTDKYTIVSFDYTAPSDNAWVQLNKEIFIKADGNDKHYAFVKAENISIAPEKRISENAGDNFIFKAYFQKIPKNTKSIDVIENPEGNNSASNYFNYYGVSLTHTRRSAASYAYTPAPSAGRVFGGSTARPSAAYSYLLERKPDTQDIVIEAQQLSVKQLAKQQKRYFDALVSEGFTEDQAIKIMTAGKKE
ncbi:MAG: hypothetical protein V4619_15915 [Bacteroidota bacterium]